MTSTPRIVAIITARGGSKRLPGKNTRPLAGKPMLAWTADAAKACAPLLHTIVLSTDDEDIAALGRRLGVDVPFMRPAALASDEAGSLEVVQHAVHFIEQRDGVTMDWVLLLQPTSPLRLASDIEATIALARSKDCDSVVSITDMPAHPIYAKQIDAQGFLQPFAAGAPDGVRRQDASPRAYIYNGAIYLTRRDILMEKNSFYGSRILPYPMPPERSVDIDTEFDFRLADMLLKETA